MSLEISFLLKSNYVGLKSLAMVFAFSSNCIKQFNGIDLGNALVIWCLMKNSRFGEISSGRRDLAQGAEQKLQLD